MFQYVYCLIDWFIYDRNIAKSEFVGDKIEMFDDDNYIDRE